MMFFARQAEGQLKEVDGALAPAEVFQEVRGLLEEAGDPFERRSFNRCFWVNWKDLTRPNSPQIVVYVGSSPPTTLLRVGEILEFPQMFQFTRGAQLRVTRVFLFRGGCWLFYACGVAFRGVLTKEKLNIQLVLST